MAKRDRLDIARASYAAYESGDRRLIEECLADDFTFYSPAAVPTGSTAPRSTFGWDLY